MSSLFWRLWTQLTVVVDGTPFSITKETGQRFLCDVFLGEVYLKREDPLSMCAAPSSGRDLSLDLKVDCSQHRLWMPCDQWPCTPIVSPSHYQDRL